MIKTYQSRGSGNLHVVLWFICFACKIVHSGSVNVTSTIDLYPPPLFPHQPQGDCKFCFFLKFLLISDIVSNLKIFIPYMLYLMYRHVGGLAEINWIELYVKDNNLQLFQYPLCKTKFSIWMVLFKLSPVHVYMYIMLQYLHPLVCVSYFVQNSLNVWSNQIIVISTHVDIRREKCFSILNFLTLSNL